MLRQRFWRSFFIGLFAVLLVGQSVSIRAKAEQTSYSGLWITENQFNGGSANGTYTYSTIAKIYTNDPSASGTVTVTYRVLNASTDSTADVPYFGYYTEVVLVNNPTQTVGSVNRKSGTFTVSGTNVSTQIVELDDDQLQALINQFISVQDAIENIDNAIDTISWVEDGTFVGYSTTRDGTYSMDPISTNQTDIWIKFRVNSYYESRLYRICTGITLSSRTSGQMFDTNSITYEYYSENSNGSIIQRNSAFYLNASGPYLDIYISSNITISQDRYCYIHIHRDVDGLRVTSRPQSIPKITYLSSNDIEFWQLMYYLSALNGQTVIINNQQTVINQQNQNNEYNQQPYNTNTNDEQTDDIEGFMVDYDNKLGFIGQSFDFITSLFGVITNADASSTIPFPGVTVPIGENGSNVTLIQAQNVDIVPNGLSNIFEYVRLANSMIIVSAVFNMAINKYKEWSMK